MGSAGRPIPESPHRPQARVDQMAGGVRPRHAALPGVRTQWRRHRRDPGLLVRLGLLRLFGSPLPGWQTDHGPVFDPACVSTADLVNALVPYLERHHGVHHVELLSGHLDAGPMQALGFRQEAVPTYRAQLYPGDEDRMMKSLKDSARRNIRRAAKLRARSAV